MADKRINDHIKTTTAANVDEFIIDSDANGTRNITYANLQTQVKQYVLNDMDEVPTQNSNNPVKSGGIFNTMAVPKYDATNRREYFEGGAAFGGNIDSSPTAGSNNAVSSGGTYTALTAKSVKNPSAFSDYTSQGLKAASQTVTINNISGGYKVIDGICYVNMQVSFTGTFANPGGWGFVKGFPAPAINGVPLLAVPVTDDTNSAALLGGRVRNDNGGILQIINSGVITGQNSTAFTFIGSYPVAN